MPDFFNPIGNPNNPLSQNVPVAADTPPVSSANVVQVYCALPLGIGVTSLPGQTVVHIDWKQYQTSPVLILRLIDANGIPINVTGATVRLRLAPLYGSTGVISEPMTLLYAAGGEVGYTFADVDVTQPGTFHLEVEAILASGVYMYFPSDGFVTFQIHSSLGGPQ